MPDGYRVQIWPSAKRELFSLKDPIFGRVALAVEALSANPRPRGCRKLRGEDRDYRVRVGDYRVMYEIHDSERLVSVYRIRHRREAYDQRK